MFCGWRERWGRDGGGRYTFSSGLSSVGPSPGGRRNPRRAANAFVYRTFWHPIRMKRADSALMRQIYTILVQVEPIFVLSIDGLLFYAMQAPRKKVSENRG